jgi:riboflavin kinase/FMN adenylyltransferase
MTSVHGRRPSVVTPGNHDGVHLGHRALVRAARERALAEGLETVAMFFDPHPTAVLTPDRAPTLLTTPARRVEILRTAGADDVVVLPFTHEFACMSPRTFVESVLIEACGARSVVVGPDFHFGHKRSGNIETLRELGLELGYDVIVVDPVMWNGAPSSSTRIRKVLAEGDVTAAAAMLTRVHDVDGLVVHGDHRGRTIGFPTANLSVGSLMLPSDGVYAVVAKRTGGALLHGVANLGLRPTVDRDRSFEVHLFDFDAEIYGETLRVGFVERIRGVVKFPDLDALKAQIGKDAAEARAAIARAPKEWLAWL